MRLSEFMAQVEGLDLDLEAFCARFPQPFLLEEGDLGAGGERELYALNHAPFRVGRHPDCEVCVTSALVSKRHAELQAGWGGGAGWGLVDTGSTNGSYLNGVRLAPGEGQALQPEDTLRFGPYRFTFLPPASLLGLIERLEEVGASEDEDDETKGWGGDGSVDPGETDTLHPEQQEALAGDLEQTSLADLLLEVERHHRTGVVEVRGAQAQGRISFRAGQPAAASTAEGQRGLAAVRRLLQERQGWYTLLAQASLVGRERLPGTFSELVRRALGGQGGAPRSELAAMLDTFPGALIAFDEAGRLVALNSDAEGMFGRSGDELRGEPVDSLFDLRTPVLDQVALGKARELPGLRADGRVFPAEVMLSRFADGDRYAYSMAVRDITTRRRSEFELLRTEDTLHHTQKMEAVGRLASGITHDFNNMLAVINGYSERLLGTELTPTQRTSLERIKSAGERAGALTRKLLSLAGRQVARPRVLDPNALLAEMLDMLESAVGESVQLRFFPAANVGCVRVDKSQLEQVVLNLVLNARDAMPDGGELIIATSTALLGPDQVEALPGLQPGLYLRLSVRDTGCGIAATDQDRIFEPFFTTKPRGKGTGLGLSVVYGVVKQSRGHVAVESASGEGTTFRLYLPITDEPVPASAPRPRSDTSTYCYETVLLVEDEEPVRELVRELLSEWGYEVLCAHDGEAGLEVLRSHPGTIHALLTDVVMPRMSGPALASQVAALRPRTRILFMSGYLEEEPPPGWPVISKPFSPRVLSSKLRELLDATEEGERYDTDAMLTRLGRYFSAASA